MLVARRANDPLDVLVADLLSTDENCGVIRSRKKIVELFRYDALPRPVTASDEDGLFCAANLLETDKRVDLFF